MCTVSWLHQEDGYQLLCNRDERRRRLQSLAPRIQPVDGVRIIAPRDGDFGGTWIASNEYGVSVCLLNGAALGGELPSPRWQPVRSLGLSRGLLLLNLANARTAAQVCERAWRQDLSPYAPFTVVALEPGQPSALVEWNGVEKAVVLNGDSFMPLASSSFDAPGARAWRRREFQRLTAFGQRSSPETLYAFHESHGCQAGAYSPCMHRADAQTVSFSWVTVTPESIGFFYAPGAPCEFRPGANTRLARAQ